MAAPHAGLAQLQQNFRSFPVFPRGRKQSYKHEDILETTEKVVLRKTMFSCGQGFSR